MAPEAPALSAATTTADGETTRVVVEVNPLTWFTLANGSVSDLSEMDFETTGGVVDFEAKMKDGFTSPGEGCWPGIIEPKIGSQRSRLNLPRPS